MKPLRLPNFVWGGNTIEKPDVYLEEGDAMVLRIAKKKKRRGTYKVIYDTGPTVLVGNLGAVFKHPKI